MRAAATSRLVSFLLLSAVFSRGEDTYLLVEGGQCEDLAGCRSAMSRSECTEWMSNIQNISTKAGG